jgi:hypothetical protein
MGTDFDINNKSIRINSWRNIFSTYFWRGRVWFVFFKKIYARCTRRKKYTNQLLYIKDNLSIQPMLLPTEGEFWLRLREPLKTIKLASRELKLEKGQIPWKRQDEFEDIEDFFALHRWQWLLVSPSLAWGWQQIEQWIKLFANNKQGAVWESYSVSERIVNGCLFLLAHKDIFAITGDFRLKLTDFLGEMATYLNEHLEEYGDCTNNHLLNNARALIIAGSVFGQLAILNRGCEIAEDILAKIIQPEGFLREKSSHYQLLIFCWLLDILWFVKKSGFIEKTVFTNKLEAYALRMADASSLLCGPSGNLLVYIGDISPDIAPKDIESKLRWYPEYWPKVYQKKDYCLKDDWFRLDNDDNIIIGNYRRDAYPDFPVHTDYINKFVWIHGKQQILTSGGRSSYGRKDQIYCSWLVNGSSDFVYTGNDTVDKIFNSGIFYDNNVEYVDAGIKYRSKIGCCGVQEYSRIIKLCKNGLDISDMFKGSGRVDVVLLWQFAPGIEVDLVGEKIIAKNKELKIDIFTSIKPADKKIKKGKVCWEYGKQTDIDILMLKFPGELPKNVNTTMRII